MGRPRTPRRVAIAAVLLGLVVVAVLVAVAALEYNSNENRLLQIRMRDAAASIAEELPSVQIPLASAAQLSDAHGHTQAFTEYMHQFVGHSGGPVAADLFALAPTGPRMLTRLGADPVLSTQPDVELQLLSEARQSRLVTMRVISGPGGRRLVFAYSPFEASNIATEEIPLPTHGALALLNDSSFRGLHYAIYFGSAQSAEELVATNQGTRPLTGRTASTIVPFGADWYFLVVSPMGSLSGTYSEMLPYGIGVVGLLLVIGGAIMVEQLVRRRHLLEERLAGGVDEIASRPARLDPTKDYQRIP